MIPFANTIRFGIASAGRDAHPVLNLGSGDLVPASSPAGLYYPFPADAFPGGPKFAASQLPAAWCNVSHWRFVADFSGLGRSLSVDTTGPAGAGNYDDGTAMWPASDPVDRFDLLARADLYDNDVDLNDSWVESLNDRRSINVSLNLNLGDFQFFDGKWWVGVNISATAVRDIDTSGTGAFLPEDTETTTTGYSSDPEGSDIGIRFLGQPILMSPLADGVGDVTFSASIDAATYYEDWFPIAA